MWGQFILVGTGRGKAHGGLAGPEGMNRDFKGAETDEE